MWSLSWCLQYCKWDVDESNLAAMQFCIFHHIATEKLFTLYSSVHEIIFITFSRDWKSFVSPNEYKCRMLLWRTRAENLTKNFIEVTLMKMERRGFKTARLRKIKGMNKVCNKNIFHCARVLLFLVGISSKQFFHLMQNICRLCRLEEKRSN